MFTIGSFAQLAGVSAKALRKYDAMGLFRPVWVDTQSSYRYYSPAQLPELRRILGLRDIGVGLDEIRSLVVGGGDLQATLDRRRRALERERREAERRLAALDIRLERGGSDVVVRPVTTTRVAKRTVEPGEDVSDAFYELESHVRDVGRRASGPPGAIVAIDGSAAIFVPIRGRVASWGAIHEDGLPAARVATIIRRGPYDALAEARSTLMDWVASTGLLADGPLRILYLQFGAEPELRVPPGFVVERSSDFVTELQLPVAWPSADD